MVDRSGASFVWCLRSQRRQLGGPDYGHGKTANPSWISEVWELDRKLDSYRLAAQLGIAHPEVLAQWEDPRELSFEGLPRQFCVKPNDSASARGCYLLSASEPGGSDELLRSRRLTEQEIRDELIRLLAERRISKRLFAEEALADVAGNTPSDDWKLYKFYDVIGFVFQVSKRDGRRWWKFYDLCENQSAATISYHPRGCPSNSSRRGVASPKRCLFPSCGSIYTRSGTRWCSANSHRRRAEPTLSPCQSTVGSVTYGRTPTFACSTTLRRERPWRPDSAC